MSGSRQVENLQSIKKEIDVNRVTHKLVNEKIFGDIRIQFWRDGTGNPYVRMERGQPAEKTFCLEHFLLFAEKVGEMAHIVKEKIGERTIL